MHRGFFVALFSVFFLLLAQPKHPIRQFAVIEVDGAIHLVRAADGPYASFKDIPAEIRQRIEHSQRASRKTTPHQNTGAQSVNFLVSNSSDAADTDLEDGIYSPQTLRSAIQNANLLGGTHSITFSPGLTVIQPSSQLPSVNVPISINGSVTAGKVIINGASSSGSFGLSVAKQSTITNIVFRSWSTAGLALSFGANQSVVRNNEFELNKVGLNINAEHCTIGGDTSLFRNAAYDNTQDGIAVVFANDNVIRNNYSGTKNGTTAAGNINSGIYVQGERTVVSNNIISGNYDAGLEIGEFSDKTVVSNNHIGVTLSGSTRLPNLGDGITTFADRDSITDNVITGNAHGITILGQASQTYVGFNRIGINASEDSLIGNRFDGIQILGENVKVEQNIVSANKGNGISITGLGGATVRKNLIGVNRNGNADWGNTGNGIYISCNNNLIGGNFASDANTISGNDGSGIEMYGGIIFSFPGPSGPNYVVKNTIQYNYIGTSNGGSLKIPNTDGITLWGYVDSNTVYNNLVSGNSGYGIRFRAWDGVPAANYVSGNYIGTNYNGTLKLGNTKAGIHFAAGYKNIIGGPTNAYANLISGNDGPGVLFEGGAENIVSSNSIGVSVQGNLALSNYSAGVLIAGAADANVISSNHISGNNGDGIFITSRNGYLPYDNLVIDNVIGLNYNMNAALPNNGAGVAIFNAENTWIGGQSFDSSNVISGNSGPGVHIEGDSAVDNSIWGNYIGTNQTGTAAIPNERGVVLYQTKWNKIGGTVAGSGNLISGNLGEGIYLYKADSNLVESNIIGLAFDQTSLLPNNYSGIVIDSSRGNLIGSDPIGIGNTISGNLQSGIEIKNFSKGNRIYNNSIGTNYTGTLNAGNKKDGIQIYWGSGGNNIGSSIAGNRIRYNTLAGIIVADSSRNNISGNSFEGNGELGIDLLVNGQFGVTPNDDLDADTGANELQNFPELSFADGPSPIRVTGKVRGKPSMRLRIEFFESDAVDPSNYGEGKRYLSSRNVTVDSSGFALINVSLIGSVTPGKFITATATDTLGNTSEFSKSVTVASTAVFADIDLTVSTLKDTVKKGDTIFYHITLTNFGPDSATNVVLKDTLSKRITHLADSSSKGTRTFASGILSVSIPMMIPGETVFITVAARADSAGAVILSSHATASQSDPDSANNTGRDTIAVSAPLTVGSAVDGAPYSYQLHQNFPNPFNPTTTITYSLQHSGFASIVLYDILGRTVAILMAEHHSAGRYSVVFDGKDCAAGIYFYQIRAGSFVQTKKLLLVK